jgi:hypothetical protein
MMLKYNMAVVHKFSLTISLTAIINGPLALVMCNFESR